MFDENKLMARLDSLLEEWKASHSLVFVEETPIDEVAMVRRVRGGKIVKKVAVKRKGMKVVRGKNGQVSFKRMTAQEKRNRKRASRKAWRVGKAARKNKAARTLRRSKVRMKTLYR